MFSGLGKALRACANKDGRGYPDWAVRYVPVAKRLGKQIGADAIVMEIGANENGLARFMSLRPIAIDVARDHLLAARKDQQILPVVASISALPFREGAVDACVCLDTFEHVSPGIRAQALDEFARVIKNGGVTVVGFPSGDASMRAEEAIRSEYKRYTGGEFRWLEEHAVTGLPDGDDIAGVAARAFGPAYLVSIAKNGNLAVWTWMWRVLICGWPGRGNALFQALLRLATPILCRIHLGKCYRTLVWIEPKR